MPEMMTSEHGSDSQGRGDFTVEDLLRSKKAQVFCDADIKGLLTVESTATAGDVLGRLNDSNSGGAALIVSPEDGSRLIGIVTERDYLYKLEALEGGLDSPIEEIMTSSPITLASDETIDQAVRLMTEGGYRHLPIVDASGKLAGIVSTQDLIGYLAEYFPMEVLNLPPDLEQDQFIATREGG